MVGERAQAVYDAINVAPRTWTRGPVSVTISLIAFNRIKNLITIEASVSFNGIEIANDRWHFVNPPTKTGDGTFTIVRRYTNVLGDRVDLSAAEFAALSPVQRASLTPGTTYQRENFSVNPLAALRATFEDTVRTVTKNFTQSHLMRNPDGTFRGDTLSVTAGTTDGRVSSGPTATTWATIQNGSSLTADTTEASPAINASNASGTRRIYQYFCEWDTSSLPDGATITGTAYTFYGTSFGVTNTDTVTAELWAYDWGGTVTTADFRDCSPSTNITNLTKLAHLALASWSSTNNAANNLVDDGGYSAVSLTSFTRAIFLIDRAYGSDPTGTNQIIFRGADTSGTTTDPKLVVTYSLANAVPVFMNQYRQRRNHHVEISTTEHRRTTHGRSILRQDRWGDSGGGSYSNCHQTDPHGRRCKRSHLGAGHEPDRIRRRERYGSCHQRRCGVLRS